jgi:hypothetical protein
MQYVQLAELLTTREGKKENSVALAPGSHWLINVNYILYILYIYHISYISIIHIIYYI